MTIEGENEDMRWSTPNLIWPTSGHAEGITELNAFDNALLDAGIGNLNLIKLSSVVPANITLLTERPSDIEEGALAPMVYTVKMSDTPGDVVAAAVGIGLRKNGHGMIFENTGGSRAAVEDTVGRMVREGFAQRGMELDELLIFSSEHKVERIGCAIAAVLLWWR
ncbi:MAG: arginine decarboxylase, pyruvoyl-dependent [bacterium]